MMVLLLVGVLAAFFAVATYTGSTWLMRQRKENIETMRSCPVSDTHASRGGKGRFMG